jgi:dipeptidyl aminopeptidase/acylaminoacyl peptidase
MCKMAPASQLTVSQTADWLAFKWIDPAIVHIPASDGVQVPAHIYRPQDIGAQPNGAAVIFVHGAGYLHNVGHFWSQYPREFMFNNFLASKGYVVLEIDYRASAGTARLAHRHLPLHGRARLAGSGGCLALSGEELRHQP